jgi:hypothetical protein
MAPTRGPCLFPSDHFPLFTKCGKMEQVFLEKEVMR